MTLGSVFFILCAITCIVGALTTALARSPMRSALGLLLTIVGIAGFYLGLNAQFLAAIQLIVYAGTVVVLYVFVLMLLGVDAIEPPTSSRSTLARVLGGVGLAGVLLLLVYRSVSAYSQSISGAMPKVPNGFGSVKSVGEHLFSVAVVPFELSTALLIVAVVGAIAIARSGKRSARTATRWTSPSSYFGGPVEPRHEPPSAVKEPTL